ncbi:MAG: class I SAM-dependent methyltransferase [Minwuia sp.]|uniref:class I SAM-dependent methyltransferase n=1 Tax=Minwuia sp. TaxID=2493630 RepID=UPI003A88E568
MGRRTLDGGTPEGWFIPYRYAGQANAQMVHTGLMRRFEERRPDFQTVLETISTYRKDLLGIGLDDPAPKPRWNQDWFAGLDAAAAYAIVRTRQPRRIVEVGSGHSTRFMARAILDGGFDCLLTAIDPEPRADISALPVQIHRKVVQQAPRKPFEALRDGDILFIDSSHILMPGTDVDLLFGEIVPALPAGVIVHIHDIFLPLPYPPEWSLRGYNEQNALAPMLMGGVLEPLFACQFARSAMAAAVERQTGFIPRPKANHDASLWTVRT